MLGFCLAGHSLLEAILFHRLGIVDILLQTGVARTRLNSPRATWEPVTWSWQLGSMALQETSWQHRYSAKGAQARADVVRRDWDIGRHRQMSEQQHWDASHATAMQSVEHSSTIKNMRDRGLEGCCGEVDWLGVWLTWSGTKITTFFAEFELDLEGSRLSEQHQARQNEGQKQIQVGTARNT